MTRRKTNEEFLQEIKTRAPGIIPLEEYRRSNEPIECECRKCGHRWPAIPNNILRGEGCPRCGGRTRKNTEQFIEELKQVNPYLTVIGEYVNNKTKIRYICENCGQEDEKVPTSLLKGHGCKYCSAQKRGNLKRHTNEWFLSELKIKNPGIVPLESYKTYDKTIRCKCVCGNVWSVSPANLLQGKRCKKCKGRKISERQMRSNKEFLRMLSKVNYSIEPLEDYKGTDSEITFRCTICGNTWSAKPKQVLKGRGCKVCQRRWQTSFPEQALYYYIKSEFPDAVNGFTDGFEPSELDIYIPSRGIGIEYDGRTHHNTVTMAEANKYNTCIEKGIYLIRVRERAVGIKQGQICDLLIRSEYGDTKKYSSLNDCISSVLDYLHVKKDINVERDVFEIKEQYYSMIKHNSLGELYPQIAKEWDYSQNGFVTPFMVSAKSGDKYHWLCSKCGRSYSSSPYLRTTGHGCSDCAGVSKKTHDRFVSEMLEKRPDIIVIGEYINSKTKIKFKCRRCGNEFEAVPHSILKNSSNGNGCAKCSRIKMGLDRTLPKVEFLKRVNEKNPTIEIIGEYVNSHTPIQCRCKKCGNIWTPKTANSLYLGTAGCAKCAGNKSIKIRCIETNEVFQSLYEAEKRKEICHSSLSKCINGKAKTAGGLHWIKITD